MEANGSKKERKRREKANENMKNKESTAREEQ